jgi:DNA-binding NtrC family response regulator
MGRRLTNENAFLKLLSEEIGPLYWIGTDRVIRYANETLATWLGLKREEFEGLKSEFSSGPTGNRAQDAVNSLCPPAEAFAGLERFLLMLTRSGAVGSYPAKAHPLKSRDGIELGLLVQISCDVAERNRPALTPADLHQRVAQIREKHRLRYGVERFLGVSEAAKRMRETIAIAMESDAATLVVGPPGSGRETIARAIHAAGGPSKRLLPILCRALDAEMLRSLIDTSAYQTRSDAVAQSLLFLEVDLLDSAGQEALLAMLREPVHPRIFSTARQSLELLAAQGKFDSQLSEKLRAISIHSLPLAERREDIPILAQAMLEEQNRGRETQISGFSVEAMDLLVCYSWPENIDQLADVVRRAAAKARGSLITADELPERIRAARHAAQHPRDGAPQVIEIEKILEQVERELIERALAIAEGNKSKAAQLLSLPRNRLLRRMEHLKMTPARANGGAEETPDFLPLSEFVGTSDSVEAE